jgi:hypothetical protein
MIAFYETPTRQKLVGMQAGLSVKGQAMALDVPQEHQADLAAILRQRAQQPRAAPIALATRRPT